MKVKVARAYLLELICCIVIAIGSIFMVIKASGYPTEAKIFPVAVLIVGIVASMVQMIKLLMLSYRKASLNSQDENKVKKCQSDKSSAIKMVGICLGFVAYVWIIPVVGFYIATWMMLLISLVWFQNLSILMNFGFTTAVVVSLYFLFTVFLKVPLPLIRIL